MESFEMLLKDSLGIAKKGIGLPTESMVEFSYPITTAVMKKGNNPA